MTMSDLAVRIVDALEAHNGVLFPAIKQLIAEEGAPSPTEHVRPEDVRVDDVLMVPVRVVTIRPPAVGGDPARPHIRAIPVAGPWGIDRAGRIWTHGWSIGDLKLERVVKP